MTRWMAMAAVLVVTQAGCAKKHEEPAAAPEAEAPLPGVRMASGGIELDGKRLSGLAEAQGGKKVQPLYDALRNRRKGKKGWSEEPLALHLSSKQPLKPLSAVMGTAAYAGFPIFNVHTDASDEPVTVAYKVPLIEDATATWLVVEGKNGWRVYGVHGATVLVQTEASDIDAAAALIATAPTWRRELHLNTYDRPWAQAEAMVRKVGSAKLPAVLVFGGGDPVESGSLHDPRLRAPDVRLSVRIEREGATPDELRAFDERLGARLLSVQHCYRVHGSKLPAAGATGVFVVNRSTTSIALREPKQPDDPAAYTELLQCVARNILGVATTAERTSLTFRFRPGEQDAP